MTQKAPTRRVLLGQIIGVHGIKGDIIVRSHTADPGAIASYGPLTDATGTKSFKLKLVRVSDKGVVVRIDGIADRTAAEKLRGQELYVERSKMPKTTDAEYYHADLIGLEAVDGAGQVIGRVIAVPNFGAGDLLEIQVHGSKATDLIPFTNACVPNVDLSAGRVTVIPPEMTGEPEPADDESDEAGDAGGGDGGGDGGD